MHSRKDLSERDICTKFITPALVAAGWDIHKQVREEWSFTDGRIIVRGHKHTRGQRKRADYVLSYKSIRLAIIEAKLFNYCSVARTYYKEEASGTSDSINNIGREQIKDLLIPLPPEFEQKAIFSKVDQLMQLCDELEQQLQQSKKKQRF